MRTGIKPKAFNL